MLDQHGPASRRHGPGANARGGPTAPDAILPGLQAVIDPLPEAILVTDASGAVRVTNVAADRLFAEDPVRTDVDLLSRFVDASGPGPGPPAAVGEPERRTVRPLHQPNTWYALHRVPLSPDDEGAAFVLRDVSNSRDLQAERDAFLAVLSHELRTPLTTIYAGSSVLARRPRLSGPATRTLAMDISLEAARLYDLVENLLVIARLERRILHPLDEPVDLGRALDTAILLAGERVPGVRIERRGPSSSPPVHGDATYVDQACRNLVLSMLRVPNQGAATRFVAGLDVDGAAGEVAATMLDDGPSLTSEQLEQAFDIPDATATGRLAGVGMGPFVVRHVVEAMGGRAWARDRDGGGLEMGFALRIHDVPTARGRGRRGSPSGAATSDPG